MNFRTERQAETLREELLRRARSQKAHQDEQRLVDHPPEPPQSKPWNWNSAVRMSRLFGQRDQPSVPPLPQVQYDSRGREQHPTAAQTVGELDDSEHEDINDEEAVEVEEGHEVHEMNTAMQWPLPPTHRPPAEGSMFRPQPPQSEGSSIYGATPQIPSTQRLHPMDIPPPPAPPQQLRMPPPIQIRVFDTPDPSEIHLAQMAEDARQRKREKRDVRRQREASGRGESRGSSSQSSSQKTKKKPPRYFLGCLPWVRSQRMRSVMAQCLVSGLLFVCLFATLLGLAISSHVKSKELTVILVVIVLMPFSFLCVSLCRLWLLSRRRLHRQRHVEEGGGGRKEAKNKDRKKKKKKNAKSAARRRRGPAMGGINVIDPNAYAMPREPIPVAMAHDDGSGGQDGEWNRYKPPAYGQWRESVRVDPSRMYWQKKDEANEGLVEETGDEGTGRAAGAAAEGSARRNLRRPPSYISEDGVSYVVDAMPMSPPTVVDSPLAGNHANSSRALPRWA